MENMEKRTEETVTGEVEMNQQMQERVDSIDTDFEIRVSQLAG